MEEKKTKEAPKSFLDYNASWPLTILYLGFLVGIYFAQSYSYKFIDSSSLGQYAYYFVAMIGGVVFTFLFYNLGKIMFARVAGYELLYIRLLGFFFDKSSGKTKVSFDVLSLFVVAMRFTPKNEDLKKNPRLIFLGGLFFEVVLLALALTFLFAFCIGRERSGIANFGWTFLYAVCFGFLTPLYELVPFRQDYPTDMYNILMTRTEEDRIAFNMYCVNQKRELTGEDFLLPEFESFDSFYKAHTLYYVYLQDLYESKLQKAFAVLEDMKYFNKYWLEDERYIPIAETVYLKYLVDAESDANATFTKIKKDERKFVTDPVELSGYRTAVLVLATIHSDKEAVLNLTKDFDKKIAQYGETPSNRVKKEISFFNSAYNKARKMKPDFELPER